MRGRELLGSLTSSFKKDENKKRVTRPPYFENEDDFLNLCKDCNGACEVVCETNIIEILEDKTPSLNFSSNGCTYCDECAKNCPEEVLDIEFKKNIEANISINILQCMSWKQTMCFSCKDPCIDDAIDFLGMFRPEINENCTSCGFCISVCPLNAIEIKG